MVQVQLINYLVLIILIYTINSIWFNGRSFGIGSMPNPNYGAMPNPNNYGAMAGGIYIY